MLPLADAMQLTDTAELRQELLVRWFQNKGSAEKDDPVWDEACRLRLRWVELTGSWDIPPATPEEVARHRLSCTPQSFGAPWVHDDNPRNGDGKPPPAAEIQSGLEMTRGRRNWKGLGVEQSGYPEEDVKPPEKKGDE